MEESEKAIENHKHKYNVKMRQELKAEILPKLEKVSNLKLLCKPQKYSNILSHTLLPLKNEPIKHVCKDKHNIHTHNSTAISSKELFDTTEWLGEELENNLLDANTRDSVKRLEHWTYEKKLHQSIDSDYQKILRANISKQIAVQSDDLFESTEMKSYILTAISEQLQFLKEMGNSTNRKKDHVLLKLATMEMSASMSNNEIETVRQIQGEISMTARITNKRKKMENELAMELQTLRIKKELLDRKKQLKKLYVENTQLLNNIEFEKDVFFKNAIDL